MAPPLNTHRGSAGPFTAATQPYAVAAFRVVIGGLFACHGASSLFGVLGGAAGSEGGTVAQFSWPGWYAAVIQLVCGGLVVLGLGTRAAAFLASGSMAYAYFSAHQPQGLWPLQNGGEPSALFCWGFFLLIFTGSGALGLDRLLTRGRRRTTPAHAGPESGQDAGRGGPHGPGEPGGSGGPRGGSGGPHTADGSAYPVST